jgi:hypothetical protein
VGTRRGGHGATSTVPARAPARERVWQAAIVQGSAWEKGKGERGPGSTALVDALARPERVWRVLGASGHDPFPALPCPSPTRASTGMSSRARECWETRLAWLAR